MKLKDIRKTFLNFFEHHNHKIIKSSPLVPHNDPTLLFTNAGMVPFKDVFTGKEKRDYSRATSAQKCIRAGGKHNDLENVGYTARHHTFFEMLGNFSFGDYFKEDAIAYAWNLVTKEFGLDPSRLLVTVHSSDEDAAKIWKKVAPLTDDKIISIPTDDNFWSMGDTGPCGPCSEIFYDHGDHIWGGPPGSKDEDGDRFIEIWNLVFMQYETLSDGKRINLPNPSIDTGMGLERMAALLQGKHNNFDIDLFQNIINQSKHLSGNDNPAHTQSHNVIADHLRSACFLMADGVLPSNEGRGYVLRRIMRRAMRHAHILGTKDPLMHQLVPALITEMGDGYPELKDAEALMEQTLRLEEERFRETLSKGLTVLEKETSSLGKGDTLSGSIAFKLYDTYGFPVDLTQDILRSKDMSVDTKGFEDCMAEQKKKARASWSGSGESATDSLWLDLSSKTEPTDFLGYTHLEGEAVIQTLIKDGKVVDTLTSGEKGMMLCNQTPFYGESGGQMGDAGRFENGAFSGDVTYTDKKQNLIIHQISVKNGTVKVGDTVKLTVDGDRRQKLVQNHSATHLLHAVLRSTLGNHVIQKGSLAAPDRLRFDFAHPTAVTKDELCDIEKRVNAFIQKNIEASIDLLSQDQAKAKGAMALFGEKYDEEVRVVSFGEGSIELCGGTHAKRTGDIGVFKIVQESSVASGIRRIEAITGQAVLDYIQDMNHSFNELKAESKKAATAYQKEIKNLKKELLLKGDGATQSSASDTIQTIDGVNVIEKHLKGISGKDLKSIADQLKAQVKSGVVIVTSVDEGKVSLVIGVTKDLTDKINAADLVKKGSVHLGGKGGGGRPDMAQAGGSNPDAIPTLLKEIL